MNLLAQLFALISLASMVSAPSFIHFQEGKLDQAKEIAQLEDKNYMVHVYADWCTLCKLMEETSFVDQDVVAEIDENYVPVKLNMDSLEGQLFNVNYSVKTLPALFIFDQNGKLLARRDKYVKAGDLRKLLHRYGK